MAQRQQDGKFYLSVRIKLLLPFLLIILFVGLFALPAVRNVVASRLQEEADERLDQTGVAFGLLLEQAEDEAELVVSFIANLPDVEAIGANPVRASAVLAPLKREFELQELSYYPNDYQSGTPALYDDRPQPDDQNAANERVVTIREELILEAIESQSVTSRIVIVPEASQILAVSPVIVEEQLNGIAVAVFFIDDTYISDIASILNVDVAIISDELIVASTIDESADLETLIQTRLDLSRDEQAFNITYADGITRRLHTHTLMIDDNQQGSLVLVRSLEDVNAVQERIQFVILVFLGVLVGVMLIYSIGVILNFAIPLKRLADAAKRVSAGRLDERVEIPTIGLDDEVVDLGQNFNTMTERLSDFYTELEETVFNRTEELVATLQELEVKRDEALEANKTKSLFLANMSHELRTPLNAIIGYSEMLEEEADDYGYTDIVPDLQKIQSAGSHLLALINDILDISKIEAGAIELYLEEFYLEDLIDTVAMTIQPVIQKNGNKIQLDYETELGEVYNDNTRMRQILTNLLSNAAKFTENGTITIRSKRYEDTSGKDWIDITVHDTGIGMTPEQKSKVFSEFTQADASTTRKYGGTGLGLPISRHFVELMGGTISIASTVGEGSAFTVKVPARIIPQKKQTGEVDTV